MHKFTFKPSSPNHTERTGRVRLQALLAGLLLLPVLLSGCGWLSGVKDWQSDTLGLPRTFEVYDDSGNQTLSVHGGKTTIHQATEFAKKTVGSEGQISIANSGIMEITIDGRRWLHAGSTLIAYEDGLVNLVNEYDREASVTGSTSGGTLPSWDRDITSFRKFFTGLDMVLIVKNQAGKTVGVFEGKDVYYEQSEVDKATKLSIDGKRLYIYRCDFEFMERSILDP